MEFAKGEHGHARDVSVIDKRSDRIYVLGGVAMIFVRGGKIFDKAPPLPEA